MISKSALEKLEKSVRTSMAEGRFQDGLKELRTAATLWGMSSDDLARQVAELSIRQGHVQPLPMRPQLEREVLN